MDYKQFSSNKSILQSSAIHPKIATADKSGHFVPVGVTSAFFCTNLAKNHIFTYDNKFKRILRCLGC